MFRRLDEFYCYKRRLRSTGELRTYLRTHCAKCDSREKIACANWQGENAESARDG